MAARASRAEGLTAICRFTAVMGAVIPLAAPSYRRAPNQSFKHQSNRFPVVLGDVVLFKTRHGGHGEHNEAPMDRKNSHPESQVSPTLRARLSAALQRRVYPSTALHMKQIEVADPESIMRWLRGEGSPSAQNLSDLIRFFWDRGDRAFMGEVLNLDMSTILPSADRIAAVLREKGMAA